MSPAATKVIAPDAASSVTPAPMTMSPESASTVALTTVESAVNVRPSVEDSSRSPFAIVIAPTELSSVVRITASPPAVMLVTVETSSSSGVPLTPIVVPASSVTFVA